MVDAPSPAALEGLHPVGRRPPFGEYLAEAWRRRSFALTLAGHRLVGSLLQNRLGVLWIVMRPLSIAILYGTIFGLVISGAARPEGYVRYIIVGVFVFEFFTGSFGAGSKAITSNAKLVQSLGFPRILLPISVVVEQAMRMIPIIVLLGILLLVFGEPIAWSWLLIFPILAIMGVFNLGAALIVARLSVHARDVQQFIPILNRVLLYISGIFFNIDGALEGMPWGLWVVHLIPTYDVIAISREVLLESYTAPAIAWVAAPLWALVTIVVGVVYFWQAEARYGLSE